MKNAATYDLVVVGAGIAGLATAELFARAGRKVALVERNAQVCRESSGQHHEWFHFGSLYAIFPGNDFMRTLIGGIDDLLAYYSGFRGMNLTVAANGKLTMVDKPGKWVRDNPIEYVVAARNDPDFSLRRFDGIANYARKIFFLLAWEGAIKQFISRHQRFHKFDWRRGQASEWVPRRGWWNYSRDVIHRMEGFSVALDPHTHFVVTGFDRPMDSQAIVADLLRSFLHHGGELMTDTTVRNIVPAAGDEPAQVATQERGTLSAPQVVVTSGRTVGQFLAGTANLKVVLSPLLVVYPAMSHHNFVRLTPFPEKTINHLCHDADGTPYSLIGGSYFAHIGDEAGLETARRELIEMARSVFPQIDKAEFVAPYESYKVEIANKALERNYQYHVKTVGEGIYAAVPGKFSLAFSLALDIFKKLTGEKPPAPPADVPDIDVSPYVSAVRHKRMVLDHMAQSRKVAS